MRLLIVDDHPMFMDGLKQGLQQLDRRLTIDQATSAESALALIGNGARPDFLLIDLLLPQMCGITLMQRLVDRDIWIPTLALSASEDPQLILRAIDTGALGFVPKTFSARELLDAINTVLRGDLFLPPKNAEDINRLLGQDSAPTDTDTEAASSHGITPRQREVLHLMTLGYSNKAIASTLFVSEHTVKSHVKAMFKTLKVPNRTACVKKAEQLGLVPPATQSSD